MFRIAVESEMGITKALLETGIRLAKTIGSFEFDLSSAIEVQDKMMDGGPVEFIGSLAIDPSTGRTVFSTTAIRFYGGRLVEDIKTSDIADAYYLASKGNQRALDSIEALRERNISSFRSSLHAAKGHNDGVDDVQPRYLYQ